MRLVLTLGALLLASEPAPAACHHYSHWAYPYPQPKCVGVVMAARTPAREDPPLPPIAPLRLDFGSPSIQPPPEEWNEDAARAFAIQKLREQMERK